MTSTIEKLMNQAENNKDFPNSIPAGFDEGPGAGTSNYVELDKQALANAGFIVTSGNYEIVEQYRLIKRRLLKDYKLNPTKVDEFGNIFLVTSALQGDGKTFTSINLALSIAMEVDRTVLLIDADVVKGGVSKTLGIESQKGFIDLLEDDTQEYSNLVYKTNIPNLTVLPSGESRLHSTELFSSEKMKVFCSELARRYHDRIIIIDSPPLLQTTESQALSALLENIVFVVSSGHTPTSSVKSALELLDRNKKVNFILNKARFNSSGLYYYYDKDK